MLKPINFLGMNYAYLELVGYLAKGFQYEQCREYMADEGYYLPKDQYEALSKVINIQISLDIGTRRDELKEGENNKCPNYSNMQKTQPKH